MLPKSPVPAPNVTRTHYAVSTLRGPERDLFAGLGQYFRGTIDPPYVYIDGSNRGPDLVDPTSPEQDRWMNTVASDIGRAVWYCQWKVGDAGLERFLAHISPASTVVSREEHHTFVELTRGAYWKIDEAGPMSVRATELLERHPDWMDLVRLRAFTDRYCGNKARALDGFQRVLAFRPKDKIARTNIEQLTSEAT